MKDTAQQLELDMGGNSGQEICLESKQTMENAQIKWTSYKISEIFDVARGGSPRPIQNYLTNSSDGLNWIMIGDTLENSKYITSTKNKIKPEGLKKTRMVHEGDFLLTNSMSFGRPYILKISGCIHDGWLVLSPKKDNVYPDFFYYLLGSKKLYQEFSKRASGAVVKNLNTSLVSQVEIPLPPLEEQKRIARILDTADELRAKRRKALAELDTLLQSVFLDMFGDPVTNPKGWEIQSLESLGRLDRGVSKHRPRNEPSLLGGPYPLVQTGDVANSEGYIRSFSSTYSDLGLKQSKMWPAGTLCITIAANIANTGILTFDACFPDSIVGFRSSEKGRVEYVQGLFWFFRETLEQRAPQVAQKNINLKILREFLVPNPPLGLQQKFAAIVEKVEQQKAQMRAHLTELDALFASLQHRAFNGEL